MAVCREFHTVSRYELGEIATFATHRRLEHLHGIHRLHTVNLPSPILLMMKHIRLQLPVYTLL